MMKNASVRILNVLPIWSTFRMICVLASLLLCCRFCANLPSLLLKLITKFNVSKCRIQPCWLALRTDNVCAWVWYCYSRYVGLMYWFVILNLKDITDGRLGVTKFGLLRIISDTDPWNEYYKRDHIFGLNVVFYICPPSSTSSISSFFTSQYLHTSTAQPGWRSPWSSCYERYILMIAFVPWVIIIDGIWFNGI